MRQAVAFVFLITLIACVPIPGAGAQRTASTAGTIAFSRDGSIWAIGSGGAGLVKITHGPGDWAPNWAPNGEVIAYVHDQPTKEVSNVNVDLYLVDTDGTAAGKRTRRIFNAAPTSLEHGVAAVDQVHDLAWSKSGSLTFVYFGSLYLASPPTYKAREVVKGSPSLLVEDSGGFSPDSRSIVWTDDVSGIYTVDVATGHTKKLVPSEIAGDLTGSPLWSLDGRTIAFTSTGLSADTLWTAAATGGKPTRVTASAHVDFLAWSPDSRVLSFSDWEKMNVMDVQSTGGQPVTLGPGDMASWAPDGSKLVVSAASDDQSPISVVSANGSGATKIATGTYAAWRP